MNPITGRVYQGEKDFHVMIDLLNMIRPAKWISNHPAKVDIEENLANEEIRANTKLWFDRAQPIGWAYVDDLHNLYWELQRQYMESVGKEVVAWGESCIRKTLTAGEKSTLDASCREDFKERLDFLNQHGFCQTEIVTVRMKRNLCESIPKFRLPAEFQIRPVRGIEEAESIAHTHRAAFGTDYMTTENRLIIMNTSEYDPSLDLVVVAPDETIAAYCTCSVNEKEKEGRTDPIATHPQYQHMGLAQALLLNGLQMLQERGIKMAILGTSGANIAMQRAAESVGFSLDYRVLWFEKEISK